MIHAVVPRLRPTWDEYFMQICDVVASRSHDHDTQVGCVIVNPRRRIVSTGYNGLPAGVDDAYWATARDQVVLVPPVRADTPNGYEADKYDTVTHAEANAIVSAVESLHGCSLYCTLFSCNECAKLIITAGIKRVFFRDIREMKPFAISKKLFEQAGIEMVSLSAV